MAQKKRSGAKKRTASKFRKTARKSSRGKIYMPLNSVITLCAVIVGVCSLLLAVFTFAGKTEKAPLQVAEKTEIKKNESRVDAEKKSGQKTKSRPAQPQQQKKNEDSARKAPENSAVKNSPEKKSVSNSIAEKKPEIKPEAKTENKTAKPEKTEAKAEPRAEKAAAVPSAKESPSSKPGWDIPDFPAARNNATLVIVFDDGGHNMSQLEKCVVLPFPVTVAVLPRLAHSAEAAERVRKSGNEVILHQPMQSVNLNVDPGEGAVTPEMDEEKIRSTVLANLYEIWPVSGMNNHEGSLITADAEKIAAVMQICSQQEIYFLDSRTNSDSKVQYVSSVMGYPYYERNIFLDNTKNRKDILSEIEKGVEFANKNGVAIMIGHVWSAEILPGILREVYPVLSAKGYKFTTVSACGALKRG